MASQSVPLHVTGSIPGICYFKLMTGIPARDAVNSTTMGASMSRCLVTNIADTLPRKAPKHLQ
jgi:hypothetical protein